MWGLQYPVTLSNMLPQTVSCYHVTVSVDMADLNATDRILVIIIFSLYEFG